MNSFLKNPIKTILVVNVLLLIFSIAIYYTFCVINNRMVSDKINETLLENKPFSLKNNFANAKMICVFEPYFYNVKNINGIQQYLNEKQIYIITKKINSWAEDSHWDLLVIYDGEYKVYHISIQSIPDFKPYKCVFVSDDGTSLYPVRRAGQRVHFDLR